MRLSRGGIVAAWRDSEWGTESLERPSDAAELLRYWDETIETIDSDYTFADLIALLRHVDDIEILSPLLGCDVPALLTDADRPSGDDDDRPIDYLYVSNVVDLQIYEPDPSQPDEPLLWLDDDEAAEQDCLDAGVASLTHEPPSLRLVDATGDDLATGSPLLRRMRAPKMNGTWKPPYHLRREFAGWGKWTEPYDGYFAAHPECDPACYEGAFALDFTPLTALLHLPLRYVPTVQFRDGSPGATGALLFETQLTITFGEFVQAVFSEIGFHGSPDERDEAREEILERAAAIERGDASEHASRKSTGTQPTDGPSPSES